MFTRDDFYLILFKEVFTSTLQALLFLDERSRISNINYCKSQEYADNQKNREAVKRGEKNTKNYFKKVKT